MKRDMNMSESIITRLRELSPEDRPGLMEKIYEKNMRFFSAEYPELPEVLKNIKCPYSFNITRDFIDIIDDRTGQTAHPEGKLDLFAEMMGDWVHTAWVDLFNIRVAGSSKYPLHHQAITTIHRSLLTKFPEYPIRFAQKKINLKVLDDNTRFSPPTIFLGIFHGLHIASYLSRTEISQVLFVEPDPERFEVSCYFLDYQRIEEQYGALLLAVGDHYEANPVRLFFGGYSVSRSMWVRVLPGYEDEKNARYIDNFTAFQTSLFNVFFPIDYDMLGLKQLYSNLQSKERFLSARLRLSKKSKIAVVAAGPSLNDDLLWLKKNQEKLIIFAVKSVVKVLVAHEIFPDFQFSLDTVIPEDTLAQLGLEPDIPGVIVDKSPRMLVELLKTPLLCPIADKASPVNFRYKLQYATPSTTNLALAFALFLQPRQLYLLGCDFGYIDIKQTHAQGGFHRQDLDENGEVVTIGEYQAGSQNLIEANFEEQKYVQTTPFLTQTRVSAESAISNTKQHIDCVNLSNGAKIAGTATAHSAKIRLKSYPQKREDIKNILNIFQVPQKNKNWEPYGKSGEEVLEDFKKEFLCGLKLDVFSWREFNSAIDSTIERALNRCATEKGDYRLDAYTRLLTDMLSTWYSAVIFHDDIELAGKVYQEGYEKITEEIEKLSWPVDEL